MTLFNSNVNISSSAETQILSCYCSAKDLSIFETVSKLWKTRCSSDDIWKIVLQRFRVKNDIPINPRMDNKSFKEICLSEMAEKFKALGICSRIPLMSRIYIYSPSIEFKGNNPKDVTEFIAKEKKIRAVKIKKECIKFTVLATVLAVSYVFLTCIDNNSKFYDFIASGVAAASFLGAINTIEKLCALKAGQIGLKNDQTSALRELTSS